MREYRRGRTLRPKTKPVLLLACTLLLLVMSALLIQPLRVYATDTEEQARNEINTSEYKMGGSSSTLTAYWNNITADTQKGATEDINLALSRLHDAKTSLQTGEYNSSLREASRSLFLAVRAEYRVYLNMTNMKIEEANETISHIPWYLGKPWHAIDLLQNATVAYQQQEILDYFTHEPYNEDPSLLLEEVHYIVFTRIEGQAIPNLFSNKQSAYNLAAESENLAVAYRDEQSGIFGTFCLIGAIGFAIALSTGLVLGIHAGPTLRHRFSTWRTGSRRAFTPLERMSTNDRSFSLVIVEASGIIVTALFTLGALTGAVMQQVKYVYQFIGYMFAYALPFIFSAVMGICALYLDQRRRRFPDLFDLTVTFFISGWFSFAFLLGLATQYESAPPNLYFIVPFSYMVATFVISFVLSLAFVAILRKINRKLSTKYLSLSSLTEP